MSQLRLIGPVAVHRHGEPLHLGSRKALALLALLALDGPRTRDTLAAWLWPQQDAAAARRNLLRELHRLRSFGLACDSGDAGALALPAGLQALSTGTGLPLEGLDGAAAEAFDEWLALRRATLATQQRQQLIEQATPEAWLQALDADPCDEALLRRTMQALADAGEAARALQLFRRSEEALHQQLGVAPSAQTLALAEALRRPTAPPAPTAAELGSLLMTERLPFVPRSGPMARIEAAWDVGRTVWLAGPPGAGKSRLARECAAARGAWLRVPCRSTDAELPYASAVRAVRLLREAAPDVQLPDWVLRELAQVMPELGPPPQALATAEARARLLAAFREALCGLLRDNFSVLVLDDWHWIDPESQALWSVLGELPIKRLVAHRSAQLPAAALQAMRRDVDAGRAELVELAGLDADEVLSLVHALSRSPGGQLFARRLQQATGGNPFFLIETLRHLQARGLLQVDEQGRWSTPFDAVTQDYAELPVPASVREAVLGRVRALGPAAVALLEAASLLGDPFDPALASDQAQAADAAAALAHAQAARLLTLGADGCRFAHDLIRQCLAESMALPRRQALHAQLAARLHARGAAPALVAVQWEQAGRAADAVPWRLAAGDAAWRVHALADAQRHWRQALADGAAGDSATQAQLALLRASRRTGDTALLPQAIADTRAAAADATPAVRAEALVACAEAWSDAQRVTEAEELLDHLAAELPQAAAAVRGAALGLRALLAQWAGQHGQASALRDEALAALGADRAAQGQRAALLDAAARHALTQGRLDVAEALSVRAVAAYETASDPGGLAQALCFQSVTVQYARSDRDAAIALLQRARALAAGCGHVPAHRRANYNLAKLALDVGDDKQALALLDEGEALAPGFDTPMAEQTYLKARYFIHYLRGRVAEADAAATRLLAQARALADRSVLIESQQLVLDLYLHTGALDRAEALLADTRHWRELSGLPAGTGALRAKEAWYWLARGDVQAAHQACPEGPEQDRNEDHALVAWVGAAVALAGEDDTRATTVLRRVDWRADMPTDMLAMLLVQHLALAARRPAGEADAQATELRARATALLAAGTVPALEAWRLADALAGRFNALSTPAA
jgi:DNA-binding SARP family transcriptional activator/predicted ATPase